MNVSSSSFQLLACFSIIMPSIIFILIYVPIVLIFTFDKQFSSHLAYNIMTLLGIIDILQLSVHFYSGVVVFFRLEIPFFLNKMIGAIFTGLWYSMLCLLLFLAYNRFSTIVLRYYRNFHSRPVICLWYFLCFLNFLVPVLIKLHPESNYLFIPSQFRWGSLATDGILTFIIETYGKYFLSTVILVSAAVYAIIFYYISAERRRIALKGREGKITVQIFIIMLYFVIATFYWNYFTFYVKMDPSLFNFVSCMIWIFMNGLHPLIYLIFHRRLRVAFLRLLRHFQFNQKKEIQTTRKTTRSEANCSLKRRSIG